MACRFFVCVEYLLKMLKNPEIPGMKKTEENTL